MLSKLTVEAIQFALENHYKNLSHFHWEATTEYKTKLKVSEMKNRVYILLFITVLFAAVVFSVDTSTPGDFLVTTSKVFGPVTSTAQCSNGICTIVKHNPDGSIEIDVKFIDVNKYSQKICFYHWNYL